MKLIPQLKTCLSLLVIAGASMPLASIGADMPDRATGPAWSYEEGATYDNLRNVQEFKGMMGAQGPVRKEDMGPAWSYEEGATYDNLRNIQEHKGKLGASGSQGPIRSDDMESTWSYAEGATYDNLRKIQSGQF
jgi:hypothetical protein